MNPYGNSKKLSDKIKKNAELFFEDAPIPFKKFKEERDKKKRKNYENALRAKNLDRLLSYDEG